MISLTLKERSQCNGSYSINAHSMIMRKINTQTKKPKIPFVNHLPSQSVLCSSLESTQFRPDCAFRIISFFSC